MAIVFGQTDIVKNLFALRSIDVTTALDLISETGPDMSRDHTIKHFTSWRGLCPGHDAHLEHGSERKTKCLVNQNAQTL